ncbi:hypothetical protein DFH11DRAFT_1726222 [Phellopilus nigrolimitatus]|nr:hypothetical protein DFH11DRAFT_1726222 [Phellopilus nigrolimitatus]
MSGEEYLFHKTSTDNVYTRKCFGMEVLTSNMIEFCDGFTQLTISAAVSVPSSPSRESFEAHTRAAWLAFRHFTPGIACKAFRLPPPDNSFAFRYTVPLSPEDAEEWVDETVFFTDDVKPLYEKHLELKDGRWWLCSADRYVAELHVSPLESGWQISIIFSHNSTDGRNSFAMMDLFLGFLAAELEERATPVSAIEWGTEVVRLAPPGSFAMSLAEKGVPPDLTTEATASKDSEDAKDKSTSPPAPVPWLYAPIETGGHGEVSQVVKFSRETTSALHAVAKKRGRTITQVVTALSTLAHAEASLRIAAALGKERFEEVARAFSTSTHYLVAWNFMNHRHKLPGGYDSYESPTSAPLSPIDGVALLLSMDAVRKLVKLDDADSVRHKIDEDAFWDDMVQEVVNAWKAIDQSLDGYFARELAGHITYQNFDPSIFHIPALIVSSVGDLGRLGLLTSYLPRVGGQAQTLAVQDVVCGIRVRVPIVMNVLYEYDGRLSCHFFSGGEYMTKEGLGLVTGCFEEWTAAMTR